MKEQLFVLFCMIFLHVIDDFHLQGWLANGKQKSWWESNAPEDMYRKDYLAALSIHSFSWTFMVMFVPAVLRAYWNDTSYYILFIINMLIHFAVDNAKANRHKINLIQDQSIHLIQILVIWIFIYVM